MRRSSVLSLALLSLTSCGVIPTQYMPNGYRYQDNTPLSSPAPSRPWLNDAAHADPLKMEANQQAWEDAVSELLATMPDRVPTTSPVSIRTQSPMSSADTAFDHYLRKGLTDAGYRIDEHPETRGIVLSHTAQPLSKKENLRLAEAKFGREFVTKNNVKGAYYLTLRARDARGTILAEQSTVAVVPYERSEYARWPGFANQPVQGRALPGKPIYERRE